MKNISVLSILFLLCLGGCAAPKAVTQDPATLSVLQSQKVALTVIAPEKNLLEQETLFRLLWLEYKNDKVSYDGSWEIEKDLIPEYVAGFKKMSINAVPFSSDALSKYQDELLVAYMQTPRDGKDDFIKSAAGPRLDFYRTVNSLKTFPSYMNDLKQAHLNYLIEVYVPNTFANAPGYGMVIVGSGATLNIVDVNSGAVVWTRSFGSSEVYQLGGDLHALEKDNLKILKEAVTVGLRHAFEKGVVKTAMGFPAAQK